MSPNFPFYFIAGNNFIMQLIKPAQGTVPVLSMGLAHITITPIAFTSFNIIMNAINGKI
jgi:hypothetical protein